jgi:RNA polymerase sigma-70 factor (ECF subfamily)
MTVRALRGEREAWDALIARHHRRVVVSLLARGLRVDRAHELAQETWARLIQQQQRGLLTELRLPNLALTQAAFLAADDARRAWRESIAGNVEELSERQHPVDPAVSAERRLLSEEQLARAQAALAECSPGARNVFLLACDGQELPHAEVAAGVGLSVQRVRQILCEVRKWSCPREASRSGPRRCEEPCHDNQAPGHRSCPHLPLPSGEGWGEGSAHQPWTPPWIADARAADCGNGPGASAGGHEPGQREGVAGGLVRDAERAEPL